MNALQKSFQDIISCSEREDTFSIDLLQKSNFSDCAGFYKKFIHEVELLPVFNFKSILTIFGDFYLGEDFKSVLSKIGSEFYAIHRAESGFKILVFEKDILTETAYCELHFYNNSLIYASFSFIDNSKSIKSAVRKEVLSKSLNETILLEKFILCDINSNKMMFTEEDAIEVVFYNENQLIP
jgi:hypothetical protein